MKSLDDIPQKRDLAQVLLLLSGAAIVMSAIGFAFGDIWLDSTRWLLVAITLGVLAVYFRS